MIKRVFVLAAFVLVFGLTRPPTWAQGSSSQPPIFTYVAEWNTPRAQWADMQKHNESNKADGTLLGYGTYENRIHSDASPTHGSWFQAESLANIFKTLDKIYA